MSKITSVEDFIKLDDREIQIVLRQFDMDDFIKFIKGISPELTNRFFANMSERAVILVKNLSSRNQIIKKSEIDLIKLRYVNKVKTLLKY